MSRWLRLSSARVESIGVRRGLLGGLGDTDNRCDPFLVGAVGFFHKLKCGVRPIHKTNLVKYCSVAVSYTKASHDMRQHKLHQIEGLMLSAPRKL